VRVNVSNSPLVRGEGVRVNVDNVLPWVVGGGRVNVDNVLPRVVGGGRIPVHTGPVPLVAILSREIYPSSRSWIHLAHPCCAGQWCIAARCCVQAHQAQNGRNPWVRASQHPKVPKGVIVLRRFSR